MKKFTLLLCLFVVSVMMPQWAVAQTYPSFNWNSTTKKLVITTNQAGTLTDALVSSFITADTIVFEGKFNSADLTVVGSKKDFNSVKTVDMSSAEFPKGLTETNYYLYNSIDEPTGGNDNEKRIYGGTLYKSSHSTTNSIDPSTESAYNDSNNKEEKEGWSVREMGSHSGEFQSGKYYKVMVADYYEKKSGWEEINDPGGNVDVVETLPESANVGDKRKVPSGFAYYKLVETTENNTTTRSWQPATDEDISNQIFNFDKDADDSNKDSRKDNHSPNEYVKFATGYTFHEWKKKWVAKNKNEIAADANISYYTETFNQSAHLGDGNDIAGFLNHYNYYYVTSTTIYYWINPSSENYNDGEQKSIMCQSNTFENLPTPTGDDQYAIVGGKEWIKQNGNWEEVVSSAYDWTQIKFIGWSTLETIILPAGLSATDLSETGGLWGDDNKTKISKIQSGISYATITMDGDDRKASIHSTSDAEFNRLKDIVRLDNLIGSGDGLVVKESVAGDYIERISWYEGHEVYHVHVTSTGSLINKFNVIKDKEGAVLWFDDACVVDKDDLLKLADTNPKFYVDLYDINKTKCPNIETAISEAFATMRQDNKQYKGLVLPKDPETVGTTLIMDRNEDATKKATCSEFIAYRNKTTTAAYIYSEQNNNRGNYVNRLTMLRDMLQAPAHNNEIVSNTTIYSISSNCVYEIGNESSGTITNTVYDILGTDKTIIETINNEMVNGETTPKIYVLSQAADDFSKADSATSIAGTPRVDLIQLKGKISSKDVKTVNSFTSGTRVLDLMGAESTSCIYTNVNGVKKNMIDSLKTGNGTTISQLQYIILPEGLDTMVVHSYPTNLPNLKAIVAMGDTLVGHLNEPGTLVKARKLAAESSQISSRSLKNVTLRGKLNASDIKTNGNGENDGLHGDATTIVTMDLEKAVFYNASDQVDCNEMIFANDGAGFNGSNLSLKHVKLPTSSLMNTIPEKCFYETKSLDSLCIPYNYQIILDGALNETNINHITTTDDQDGAFIDNGPNTYTFSRNLTQLGTTPYTVDGEGNRTVSMMDGSSPRPVAISVFPKETGVKDIYSLATLVPKCYKNVFEYSLTFGYGGQDQTKVYCRDRYYNNGDTRKSFTVLRYPSEEVYERRKTKQGRTYEDTYTLMEQKYTDITKEYTKKDQTGAVDANGNALLWPSRTEGNRTYNQACVGALWNDWTKTYAGENNSEINDGESGTVSADTTQNNQQNQNNPSRRLVQRRSIPHSDLIDYLGWHQIVLTQATYVEPVEEEKNVVIRRDYEDAGWFTFCIPFDMTYSQVVKMMGVPASTDKVESYYNGTKVENNDSMPDIRQLKSVIRTPNKNNTNTNEILFRLTSNLADKENKTAKYYNFEENGDYWVPSEQSAAKTGETDKRCLVGGRPYVIKAYKRVGETIKDANLGKYILTRYADEFSSDASCVNTEGTYEQLSSYTISGSDVVVDDKNANLTTMKFAKPYENHKVQAYLNSETNGGQLMFKDSKGNEHPYYYAMVGQFWQQDLPQYCVYMTRSQNWRIYTDPTKNFVWDPYKCVIMATPEVTTTDRVLETTLTADTAKTEVGAVTESLIPNTTAQTVTIDETKKLATPANYATTFNRWGGGFRYVPFCYFPMNYNGTKDWIPAPMTLWFFGRSDYSFENQYTKTKSTSTRYVFSLDGDDDIFDFGDDATAIKTIDTLNGETQLSSSTRVYSLSGQYMGNTTEGLSKGVYIVGGRKIVVE